MLRDFQELRKIGIRAGFKLSDKADNDVVRMLDFAARPRALDRSGRALQSLLQAAAQALGKPVEDQFRSNDPVEKRDVPFLHFMMPKLSDGTAAAAVYTTLEAAWNDNARVRFRYANKAERRVEPYRVLHRSGRYYLFARDLGAKDDGWRYFALDQISTPIVRAGTFAPREIPPEYSDEDAIGWIKSGSKIEVGVLLSPVIADSAASRVWQRDQRVTRNRDGSASIVLCVSDVDEVVRWALGFGVDAKIVSPDTAVARAAAIVASIADAYGCASSTVA
ncbi:MAG: WYL domain-containing protein [Candidatus Eremiobacteraeota bacterium]|nr:WYL domain-containing protein [Candidatus Eremiobacteraeota bacterium]